MGSKLIESLRQRIMTKIKAGENNCLSFEDTKPIITNIKTEIIEQTNLDFIENETLDIKTELNIKPEPSDIADSDTVNPGEVQFESCFEPVFVESLSCNQFVDELSDPVEWYPKRIGKQKRTRLTIDQKLEILEKIKVKSVKELAAEYKVSLNTIKAIFHKREKIEQYTSNAVYRHNVLERKSMRSTQDEYEELVYQWFLDQKSSGTVPTGPIILEKANYFRSQLNLPPLSTGWLCRFKERKGIRVYRSKKTNDKHQDANIQKRTKARSSKSIRKSK